MTKALVLFTTESIENRQAFPDKLKELLEKQDGGLSVDVATFDDLSYVLSPGKQIVNVHSTGKLLNEYDVVYLRRITEATAQAIAVGMYCIAKGIPVFDAEIAARPGSMGKLNQYMKMSLQGFPFPDTVYASSHARLLEAFASQPQSFPLILKCVSGRRGSDNYLVNSQDELKERLAAQPDVHFLIQAYVPNSGDYRVWVTGDKIGPVLYRLRTTGHMNNTSQGSSANVVDNTELPVAVQTACVKVAAIFDRDVAGVDVVFANDDTSSDYYFLEVNRAPQIENTPHEDLKAAALAAYMQGMSKKGRVQ